MTMANGINVTTAEYGIINLIADTVTLSRHWERMRITKNEVGMYEEKMHYELLAIIFEMGEPEVRDFFRYVYKTHQPGRSFKTATWMFDVVFRKGSRQAEPIKW